ncbi:sigma-70 family RNA polymerase sigma factor [Paenibacillus sp. JX-17]|uniref:Sigma-70 family RNA polymerase sigma factor n=1 Tax=Paenibacillus lacisoli TaxID=3064525 RepID=A0ABT9CGG9_9BACL|nr:sigma-70 family RNA polymerase sigma factor [Paenibacillus sp. JX-17]MDO7906703.1 sigma-70 family RNA polymerase sigma factor [Paenibacillus sp. JX-17]
MDEEIEACITRVQNGETDQYTFIVQRFQHPIFLYCWRLMGNRQDAEDAVQDILVKAFENIYRYRPDVRFASWLYKLAYHHCLNLLRRRNFQRKLKLVLFDQETIVHNPDYDIEKSLFSEPLSLALQKLTIEERNLLVLRVFEEKPFGDIGIIMGKSTEAVKKKYSRTRAKLMKQLHTIEEVQQCLSYETLSRTKA